MKSRTLLQKALKKKKQEKGFSLRKLALKVDVSPGYLSKVLSGLKQLPSHLIEPLIRELEMDELTASQFIESLTQEVLAKKIGRTKIRVGKNEIAEKNLPAYELLPYQAEWLLSKWYRLPLMDLITCSNFKMEPAWIAAKLRISERDVVTSLKQMEVDELILKNDQGIYEKRYLHLRFPTLRSKSVIRDFHKSQMKRAMQRLDYKTSEKDFSKRLITGVTAAANPEAVKEAMEILHRALYEASQVLSEGPCTEVYQINLQLFPQTD